MARLTTEDDFWDICALLAPQVGSMDAAIGQAMRFRRLAQARYKHKKIITNSDFVAYGFHPALVGTFAAEVTGGYIQIYNNMEHHWLLKRVAGGKKGGASKSEKKTKNLKQNAAPPTPVINDLAPKLNRSKSKPLPLSLPLSQAVVAKTSNQKLFKQAYEQDLLEKKGSSSIDQHWLKDLWNDNCGKNLHKVVEIDVETRKRINAAVKKCSDREKWVEAIKKVAASKYCNGKGRVEFFANFFWLLKPGIREKIASGVYSENNAPLIESSNASDWGKAAESKGITDKKALAAIAAANQAVFKKPQLVS